MNTDKIYAESIINEYAPKDQSKVLALKKLDRKAKLPAIIFVYSFGIIMVLLFGLGMCLSMKIIGTSENMVVIGIVIGIIAMIGLAINYPIYLKILKTIN